MEAKARKTVIITGGTTGIGKATAIKFAENDYNVVITSRDAKKEAAIKNEFKDKGMEVDFQVLDVRNEGQVEALIKETVAKYGKLDVMVNNSGISLGNAVLAETESDDLKQMLDTNVMGVYYVTSRVSAPCWRISRPSRTATPGAPPRVCSSRRTRWGPSSRR